MYFESDKITLLWQSMLREAYKAKCPHTCFRRKLLCIIHCCEPGCGQLLILKIQILVPFALNLLFENMRNLRRLLSNLLM